MENTQKIKIKRIDRSLPLPEFHSKGAVAFDIYARNDIQIGAKEIGLIASNLIVEVPDGLMLAIVPRSSTPRKKNLLIPHGIGVIDQDYHGPKDEVLVQVYNFSEQMVKVEKGERIAQGILIKIEKCEFEEIEGDFVEQSRGGFGSTGEKIDLSVK